MKIYKLWMFLWMPVIPKLWPKLDVLDFEGFFSELINFLRSICSFKSWKNSLWPPYSNSIWMHSLLVNELSVYAVMNNLVNVCLFRDIGLAELFWTCFNSVSTIWSKLSSTIRMGGKFSEHITRRFVNTKLALSNTVFSPKLS